MQTLFATIQKVQRENEGGRGEGGKRGGGRARERGGLAEIRQGRKSERGEERTRERETARK